MTDIWFAGGIVADGSGEDPVAADVCVTGDTITGSVMRRPMPRRSISTAWS